MGRNITIHEALGELKLLDKRINKKISNGDFVTYKKASDIVIRGVQPVATYNAEAKKEYQSIVDLIKRRAEIKSKIVASNATVKIKVGQAEMTVAEAIERKSSIEYEIDLLRELKEQYSNVIESIEEENRRVDAKIEKQYLNGMSKDIDAVAKDALFKIVEDIKKNDKVSLVDPLGIENIIKELEFNIDEFESNVDTALSISNAITLIEVTD